MFIKSCIHEMSRGIVVFYKEYLTSIIHIISKVKFHRAYSDIRQQVKLLCSDLLTATRSVICFTLNEALKTHNT